MATITGYEITERSKLPGSRPQRGRLFDLYSQTYDTPWGSRTAVERDFVLSAGCFVDYGPNGDRLIFVPNHKPMTLQWAFAAGFAVD